MVSWLPFYSSLGKHLVDSQLCLSVSVLHFGKFQKMCVKRKNEATQCPPPDRANLAFGKFYSWTYKLCYKTIASTFVLYQHKYVLNLSLLLSFG